MSKDLTIIYSSAHKAPEAFLTAVRQRLYESAKDYPIVELHSTPDKSSIRNYYHELLMAAKHIQTPFLSFAEDDTLYPQDHFDYRSNVFAYNMTRWNLLTWSDPPFFYLCQRRILATLIAPRQLFIDWLEERFRVDPEGKRLQWWGEPGRNTHEKRLGVTLQPAEDFQTYNPIVVFSHEDSFGYGAKRKRAGKIRALEIPYFGSAKDVIKLYKE